MQPLPAIEDSPKIERHEKYQAGNAPDFELSDHIVFVLAGQENHPESFLKNFKQHYESKYDGKKLVFLHTCGGHWTTYECDYNYDTNSEPVIKRHEIRGDGRCGLHAVAKALAIVGGKNDLVKEEKLHGITHFQVPADIGTEDNKIFDHLGLNKDGLSDVWIGRVETENPNNPEGPKVVKSKGQRLIDRISKLQSGSSSEDWLSSEDIENILLKTSICAKEGRKICLASQNESFNILPGAKEKRWNAEILSIIYDDKYWQKDRCTKSFESFPAEKGAYFTTFLSSSTTRNDALSNQLDKFKGFRYSKNDGGIIEITSDIDKFNRIDTLQEKEKFCQFVFENIGSPWLDEDAKKLIHQTLMFLKISNMLSGNFQENKHIYSPNFSAEDRIARNDLYDELLKFYPLTGDAEAIDDSKKSMINSFLRQAFTDGIEMKSGSKIKISDDGAVRIKGGKIEECKINKINSVNYTDCNKEKLKSRMFLELTYGDGETKVVKVSSEQSQIEFTEIEFQNTSPKLALYSEYVRYAEENKGEESDFFSLQPQKFKGYGLKIRLEADKLYFEECFNDDYRSILNGKENKKITKINGENLQTHLTRAKTLGIEPKYYINSLFRAEDSDIKLTFDNGDEVELSKKKIFEKNDEDQVYMVKEGEDINVEEKKKKVDRMMISKKKVRFAEEVKKNDGFFDGFLNGITDKTEKMQFKAVIEHIDKRFALLEKIIQEKKPKVIIFAKDKSRTEPHSLGTGLAVRQRGDAKISNFVIKYIDAKITELEERRWCKKETYEELKQKELAHLDGSKTVICRGPIYSGKEVQSGGWVDHDFTEKFPPSKDVIHVWGANVDNFNTKDGDIISGGGQAAGIGEAKFGKFGIFTTNLSLNTSNLDILKAKDLIYESSKPSPSPIAAGIGAESRPRVAGMQ